MRRVCSSALQPGFRLSSADQGRGVSGGAAVASSVGGSGASAFGRRLVVLLVGLVGAFVLSVPGAAWATTGHTFAGQFGGAGSGDGQFLNGLWGVTVMPSTGEVFALSGESGRVQRFDAEGVFQSGFGADPTYNPVGAIAADPAGFGSVYVLGWGGAAGSAVLKYSASGVFAYQLDAASAGVSLNFFGCAGLAVDPVDGTVYVAAIDNNTNTSGQVIARFDGATGAFIDSFDGSDSSPDGVFQCPSGLVVDGSHRVYVLDKGRVDQYSATGTWEATVDDGSDGTPTAVAADPVSDEVYVSRPGPVGMQVAHLTAGGTAPVYTFDATGVGGVRAMSVGGTGTVYIADTDSPFVKRFTRFDGPTVQTLPPSVVQARSATLDGTIDPEGIESTYHVEYGTDETYGSSTEESDPVTGSDPVAATAVISGLEPSKTYHYRIVGSNASGSIVGDDQSFTTEAAPPTVDAVAPFVSSITPRGARLHSTVNANNSFSASWHFEYGTSTAYGSPTPDRFHCFFNCDARDVAVSEQLSGLQPGTRYHFRVVADNATGQTVGMDQTFITAPAAAAGATDLTTRRATLTATVNPHGEATIYYFNYGPTASYGASTPEVDAGDGDGDQLVTQSISGLKPATVYHVQVVAKTGNVTRFGADGLFETPPAPKATAISPTAISTGSATLAGTVETHGQTGSYHFNVSSLDSDYSTSTPDRAVAGNASAEHVTAPVSGLPSDEMLAVELVVQSNEAIDVSDQVTFATAPLTRVFPTAPTGNGSYGCKAPRLDAYNRKPKPGDTIKITGQDLGIGGGAVFGDRSLVPTDWTTTGFSLEVPDDATGALGLTVDCGQRSNTIAITIAGKPANRFAIRKQVATAGVVTLSVRVPGPGRLNTAGANTKPAKATVKRAGSATIKVKLTRAGRKALKSTTKRALRVATRVRFTPAGGKPATKTVVLTFKKAGR